MAEPIKLTVTAKDDASRTLDEVKAKGEEIQGLNAEVTVTADDEAGAVLDGTQATAEELDGTVATVETDADDNASGELQTDLDLVDELDGSTPSITPDVDDSALGELQDIEGAVEELDGATPSIEPQVDSSGLDSLQESAHGAKGDLAGLGLEVGVLQSQLKPLGATAGSVAETIGKLSGPTAAAGGIGLIAGAVLKAATAYEELALQSQRFSIAAGTSTEEAGRWIEVSGDLGVSADTVQAAIGRMNKNLGDGKFSMAEFGITAGNSTENFVALLTKIRDTGDASKQAALGAQIFGKGWQALAPIIADLDQIPDRLRDVAAVKAPTADQIAKAEQLRDAMDNLHDRVEEVALSLGQDLVPALADAARETLSFLNGTGLLENKLKDQPGIWDAIKNGLGLFTGGTLQAEDAAKKQTKATEEQNKASADHQRALAGEANAYVVGGGAAQLAAAAHEKEQKAVEASTAAAKINTEQLKAQKTAADALTKSLQNESDAMLALGDDTFAANKAGRDLQTAEEELPGKIKAIHDEVAKGKISQAEGARQIAQANDDLAQSAVRNAAAQAKMAEDTAKASGATFTAKDHLDSMNASLLTSVANLNGPAKQAVIDHIARINGIPSEAVTDILANTDPKNLAEQQAKIDDVSRARTVDITANLITETATQQYGAWVQQIVSNPPTITPQINMPFGSAGPQFMAGGPVNESGFYDVGEAGRERVFLPGGSNVMSAGRLMTAEAGGGGVTHIINLNVQVDPTVSLAQAGSKIADALEAYYRSSGSRRAYAPAA